MVKDGEVESALPVFVLDPDLFGVTPFGSPKTGPFRAKFLLESVLDLKERLRGLASDLLVLTGRPEDQLLDVVRRTGSKVVLTEQKVTDEEQRANSRVRSALGGEGARLAEIWGNTLYHIDDVPFDRKLHDLPSVFTPFRNKCEESSSVRSPKGAPERGSLPLPVELPGLDFVPSWGDLPGEATLKEPEEHKRSAFTVRGGEEAALARLKHYLWDTDMVRKYFDVRNGMLGTEYSTKLSASLALGCISARRIHHEIRKYEEQRTKNKSTYWVIFELIWRDFFCFFAKRHGSRIFQPCGLLQKDQTWSLDQEALQRWKDGQTGWPLVDANMRELKETGWMSNRGRQNVASYLALDLGLDWRAGADHFESFLVDYDAASNWGNWVAAAGLTGGRINKFNITKQGNDYDKGGEYVRAWVPELRSLTGPRVHEPWKGQRVAGYPERLRADDVEEGKAFSPLRRRPGDEPTKQPGRVRSRMKRPPRRR